MKNPTRIHKQVAAVRRDFTSWQLENALRQLAAGLVQSAELTTGEILNRVRENGTVKVVLPFECRDQRRAVRRKLRELCGSTFTGARGRPFELGKREETRGRRYVLRFLAAL